jgi:simple sugar transport system ATP-binding protein
LQPDEGEIFVRGRPVSIRNPQDAMKLGIGMVHQNCKLFETLSVSENIFYGLNPAGRFYVNQKTLHQETEDLLKRYNIKVDPAIPVRRLPLGLRQKIEIAKILCRGAEILILDEPTAVLTPQETRDFFNTLTGLAKEGRSVIFISHKLEEVLEISDRITVMRKGKVISTLNRGEADQARLAKMMVGRDVFFQMGRQPVSPQHKVLEVENLCVTSEGGLPSVRDCTFSISSFEIFAVAGVAGNGQRGLVEALTGMRPVQKGRFSVNGRNMTNHSPRKIREAGARAIPEDRDKNGLILDLTVEENFILTQT